jgi:hypothetical protein
MYLVEKLMALDSESDIEEDTTEPPFKETNEKGHAEDFSIHLQSVSDHFYDVNYKAEISRSKDNLKGFEKSLQSVSYNTVMVKAVSKINASKILEVEPAEEGIKHGSQSRVGELANRWAAAKDAHAQEAFNAADDPYGYLKAHGSHLDTIFSTKK